MRYKAEFFVGVLGLLSLFSILFLMIQVSDVNSIFKNENGYKIKAMFKNIGNLKKKARVTIGGVKIGFVTKIELKQNKNQEYYPEIEIQIIDKNIKIPEDSTMSILMSSLLGDSYIQIELGNEDKFLENGGIITLTTQALIIEDLISKFALNK